MSVTFTCILHISVAFTCILQISVAFTCILHISVTCTYADQCYIYIYRLVLHLHIFYRVVLHLYIIQISVTFTYILQISVKFTYILLIFDTFVFCFGLRVVYTRCMYVQFSIHTVNSAARCNTLCGFFLNPLRGAVLFSIFFRRPVSLVFKGFYFISSLKQCIFLGSIYMLLQSSDDI